MRAASRLLASVRPGQFLEPGAPTGLTGLVTHPSPRSTLVYLYQSTLDKLKHIPESSVYRQSTEALTKQRLAIIEAAKPAGFEEWQQKIEYQVSENPSAFEVVQTTTGARIRLNRYKKDIDFRLRASEWDGEVGEPNKEGPRTQAERTREIARMAGPVKYDVERDFKEVELDPEPPLTAEQ
jgi:NADH dehydrogenase (ubiquinone) 1 alpha subcomplex subunit 5